MLTMLQMNKRHMASVLQGRLISDLKCQYQCGLLGNESIRSSDHDGCLKADCTGSCSMSWHSGPASARTRFTARTAEKSADKPRADRSFVLSCVTNCSAQLIQLAFASHTHAQAHPSYHTKAGDRISTQARINRNKPPNHVISSHRAKKKNRQQSATDRGN